MCDDFFDDFNGDGYEDDFVDDCSDDFQDGIEAESKDDCEGIYFGHDLADFAIVGGFIGYLEEEIEERKRLEREMEKEQECADKCKDCSDPFDPSDYEP